MSANDATIGLQVWPLHGLPIVQPGDDLAELLASALVPLRPRSGDVLVVTSKVVAKAEGRFVNLRQVTPSPRALALAAEIVRPAQLDLYG